MTTKSDIYLYLPSYIFLIGEEIGKSVDEAIERVQLNEGNVSNRIISELLETQTEKMERLLMTKANIQDENSNNLQGFNSFTCIDKKVSMYRLAFNFQNVATFLWLGAIG